MAAEGRRVRDWGEKTELGHVWRMYSNILAKCTHVMTGGRLGTEKIHLET